MADQNDGPFLQNVDRASALAIARLQLRENEQYSATMRGFRRGQRGETDEELALRLDREYLQQQITDLLRQQAANAARGNEGLETVRETTGGTQEAVLVNVVAAISLSNASENVAATRGTESSTASEIDAPPTPAASVYEDTVETSQASSTEDNTEENGIQCVSCLDRTLRKDIIKAPCGDDYCRECIQELFTMSLKDDSLFPPRCCSQPIPSDALSDFLPPEVLKLHQEKKEEFETLDKTYCSDAECSTFLRPADITRDKGTCSKCGQVTCTMCKAVSHDGVDCPKDEATQEFLEFAKEHGWQRCSACRNMVSISTGCNHMRCRCNAQWCYRCGVTWKQCKCPQYTEALLLERANELADRQTPQAGVGRQEQVDAIRRQLREHCDHGGDPWEFTHGSGTCENCMRFMPTFLQQCGICGTRWCRRCQQNRA